MEHVGIGGMAIQKNASMEPEFALRMEQAIVHRYAAHEAASMEPEFALRMEPEWREMPPGGSMKNSYLIQPSFSAFSAK